jgi:multiple sugar transport system permease protein
MIVPLRSIVLQCGRYLLIAVALFLTLFPLYWLLISSLKSDPELFRSVPTLIPEQPTVGSYRELFAIRNVGQFLLNSTIVVSLSVVASMVIGSAAAYSLARFRSPANQSILFAILVTRMIPGIVIVVPIFLMIRALGLLNTYAGLSLVYTALNLPFVIWMMRSFFNEIPIELEEAAMVDGDSRLSALLRIVLPLAAPGLAATAFFAVITTYNEFVFALILTSTDDTMTVPVGTATLSFKTSVDWGAMTAMAIIGMLPVIILAITLQRHFVRGLTLGALK